MALGNHILTITEPTIKLDELTFESFNEEDGDTATSRAYGFDGTPFIMINGYDFRKEAIKSLEIRIDGIVPTIELIIVDTEGQFNVDTFPRDGDVINLRIAARQEEQYKDMRMDFDIDSVDSPKKSAIEQGLGGGKYSFSGRMKVPGLYAEECKSYGSGTSLDHLESIANDLQLGLATNIDVADDAMNLVVAYEPIVETIQDLVKHSYVSEESFQTVAIDQYYYINYVDINALLNSENDFDEENIINLIENFNEAPGDENTSNEIKSKLLLTNHQRFESTNMHILKYNLNNKSGSNVKKNGYKRTLQFFENDSEEGLVSFDIEPLSSNQMKDIEEPLKGRRDEDRYKKEVKFKYMGRKNTDPDTSNTHLNYTFSEIHNKQNLEELDKLSLTIEMPAFNPSLHRFQKIPVVIYNVTGRQTGADTQLKKNQTDYGFDPPAEANLEDKLADGTAVDNFLSGFYVIGSIIYRYSAKTEKISQELNLLRREWPSRTNNINEETVAVTPTPPPPPPPEPTPEPTPVDAVMGEWSEFGPCENGQQKRTREVLEPAQNGGATGELEETQKCTAEPPKSTNVTINITGNVVDGFTTTFSDDSGKTIEPPRFNTYMGSFRKNQITGKEAVFADAKSKVLFGYYLNYTDGTQVPATKNIIRGI